MTTYIGPWRLWQGIPLDPATLDNWAPPVNSNFELLQVGAMGGVSVSIAGLSTYTLTAIDGEADESRPFIQNYTGALSGNCSVVMPDIEKLGWAINATTGGHNVVLEAGAGTQVTIPPTGYMVWYRTDGLGNVTTPSFSFDNVLITTLSVSGLTVGTLSVSGNLGVTGTATLGALTVSGVSSLATVFATNETISGVLLANSATIVTALTANSALITTGLVANTLYSTTTLTANSALITTNTTTATLTVNGNAAVAGILSLGSALAAPYGINVATLAAFNCSVAILGANNLQVSGSLDVTAGVTVGTTVIATGQMYAPAFNITSDRRLKVLYGEHPDVGVMIDAITVHDAAFKTEPDARRPMIVADELQKVCPWAVQGEPGDTDVTGDIVPQYVDLMGLVPALIAEIQSLRTRVAALEHQG